MPDAAFADVLACPRCELGLLSNPDETWSCRSCGLKFPALRGIPCLFVDPGATLSEWRMRLQFSLEKLAYDAAGIQAELQNPRLRALTRERLLILNRAYLDQARRLKDLLNPLAVHQMQAGVATHMALQTRLPADQGLTTYYPNIHRDWVWGAAENEAAQELVGAALKAGPPAENLIVLGAGAGRLAYDLHQRHAANLTLALDFNPLLALVARSAFAGDELALWEFPIAPRAIGDQALLRTLAAPEAARPGLAVVLADALQPPLKAESADVIITPWLVDILPEDFRLFAPRINGLLKPGGRWISFGSLAFSQPAATNRYSLEEVLAIVMDSGFGEPAVREDEIPYMCSPASRHGRREVVVTLAATRDKAVARPPRHRALPDWLVVGTQPVPLLQAFQLQAMTTRIYSFLMGLIDGRRSLKDMARLLADQRLMPREEAEPAVRNFLMKMYDDSQRPPGF